MYAGFDFVIIIANYCTLLESLRLTHQKIRKKTTDYKIKHSHIQNFTLKMLIEWTTVTFCSASLLTNKYREGVSSVKMRSTSPNVVSVYTQIRFWDSI